MNRWSVTEQFKSMLCVCRLIKSCHIKTPELNITPASLSNAMIPVFGSAFTRLQDDASERKQKTENKSWISFPSSDIIVWENFFMSPLICLWPQRCQAMFGYTGRFSRGNRVETLWTFFSWPTSLRNDSMRTHSTHSAHAHVQSTHPWAVRRSWKWKTRRKPEHDWRGAGRKWNTPLDLNRKQPGKEDSDRMYTHTFRELEFYGLERCFSAQ